MFLYMILQFGVMQVKNNFMKTGFKFKQSAYNGVANFLVHYNIPTRQKNLMTADEVNSIMIDFIISMGDIDKVSQSIIENANYCQLNWGIFVKYVKSKYSK